MEPIASVQSIRDAEAAWFAAHPGGDLMARAAHAVALVVRDTLAGREHLGVLVVAGPGNNAGDALFAAAEVADLADRRIPVWVWPVAGTSHHDGLQAALGEGAVVVDAAAALTLATCVGVVLDGLSGLGGRPGLPDAVAAVARASREAGVPVVAVDLPSGLAADACAASDSVVADVTVTFIARKFAQVAEPAASACGRVHLVDIGVAAPATSTHLVTEDDLRAWYPWPGPSSDKYSRGVVGLDTGTDEYPGAALLGTAGALHAGAGMVRFAGPGRERVLAAFPSVVASPDPRSPGRVQAWVCGSGWPDADAERLRRRLSDGVPCVVDAGALAGVDAAARDGLLPPGSLLTPHAGELARLLRVERAAVVGDPLGHARAAASATGAAVLLKGATQYCVAPDGEALIVEAGPAWTATAGSGDVLAGMAGALLAAGVPALRAGALASALQARAAAAWPGPHTPDELARQALPGVIAALAR